MILDQINLNYLRIFESVYRTGSMTQAAQELYLTQSGISQHIRSLEDSLGVKLFDRIKQKLIPTGVGKKLYSEVFPHLKSLEQTLQGVVAQDQGLIGEVTIGMPAMFGLNLVIPVIKGLVEEHTKLQVNMRLDLGHGLNQMLLSGEVDFAFVDDFHTDSQIKTAKVYDEILKMYCSQAYLRSKKKEVGHLKGKDFYEHFDYIAYKKEEPLIRYWFKQHFKISSIKLKVRSYVADALAISRFITSDLGVGVLPRHHARSLLEQGHKLHEFDPQGKDCHNKISIATVKNRTHSASAQKTMEYLLGKLK